MKTKFKLKFPYDYGDEKITELELRRPKGKDLRKLPPEPGTGDILNLAARLADVAPSVIDEMDAADVVDLIEVVKGFLQNAPQTGEIV